MATQSFQPAAANQTNQAFAARAIKYTQPKDMGEIERDCHIAIRNFFRELLDADGVESIKKATIEQLRKNIELTATYVKAGTVYESKKISIADMVVVSAWALRYEANEVAKAEEITVGRAIEKYIIADFDFEAASGKKAEASKAAPAKKQPAEPAAPAVFGDWVERPDLLSQLEFHGAESPSRVAELLEAWNMGGDFRLLVRRSTALAVKVETLNEQDDRQTLVAFDVNGKKVGMAYMDKLAQYFTVVEKTA